VVGAAGRTEIVVPERGNGSK